MYVRKYNWFFDPNLKLEVLDYPFGYHFIISSVITRFSRNVTCFVFDVFD